MKNLKDAPLSDMLATISDRRKSPTVLAEALISHWACNLYERRPSPALIEAGVVKPTDLDLSTLLSALVERRAVISLPSYKSKRGRSERAGEQVLSTENRHGHLVGLRSNQSLFSFSIIVEDANVVVTNGDEQKLGGLRSFMLLDFDGKWYDGWKGLVFLPTAKENDWLHDKKLWVGNTLPFEHFVHPNRWTSFYGKYYFAAKAMIMRLSEECSALRRWIKTHRTTDFKKSAWAKSESSGPTQSVVVDAFKAEVDGVMLRGKFRPPNTLAGAENRLKVLTSLNNKLKYATRCTELAFYRYGRGKLPSWMKGAEWEEGVKPKGSRKLWNQITIPGSKGIKLRYRIWQKSEKVAA